MFKADAPRRRNLIGLTPLIDVVFILLVFFMLTSSFLQWRAIDLATPGAAGDGGGMKGAMLVVVGQDGLRLGSQSLTLAGVVERVSARLSDNPDQRVFVRADEGVPLQAAVTVLDGLRAAGTQNLSLIGR